MANEKDLDVVVEQKPKKEKTNSNDKKKKVEKNRIMEVLTKEYKYENLILGILAIIVALIACYLITGDLVFNNSNFTWIQGKEKTIGWVLVLFSGAVLLSLFIPFFKPSYEEVSKVTFPDAKEMRIQSARVFTFMIFFSLIFLALGIFFKYLLVEWLEVIK